MFIYNNYYILADLIWPLGSTLAYCTLKSFNQLLGLGIVKAQLCSATEALAYFKLSKLLSPNKLYCGICNFAGRVISNKKIIVLC